MTQRGELSYEYADELKKLPNDILIMRALAFLIELQDDRSYVSKGFIIELTRRGDVK